MNTLMASRRATLSFLRRQVCGIIPYRTVGRRSLLLPNVFIHQRNAHFSTSAPNATAQCVSLLLGELGIMFYPTKKNGHRHHLHLHLHCSYVCRSVVRLGRMEPILSVLLMSMSTFIIIHTQLVNQRWTGSIKSICYTRLRCLNDMYEYIYTQLYTHNTYIIRRSSQNGGDMQLSSLLLISLLCTTEQPPGITSKSQGCTAVLLLVNPIHGYTRRMHSRRIYRFPSHLIPIRKCA